jgi:hypothetical protein
MHSGTVRGAQALGSANWLMLEAANRSETNLWTFGAMASAEPFTLGECGYPRLLTPGFLCFENALEDRQHSHPLIMELSARYERTWHERGALQLQAALVAEPAFGPTPYFHRASAQHDPIAPLTNDLLNPAHAAYGVVTVGAGTGRIHWQGSVFNGRAPDRNPYDFDLAPLHSYATRVTAALGATTRAQASFADFQSSGGNAGHHGASGGGMRAWSASLEHATGDAQRNGALTLAWAAHRADGQTVQSGLLEGQLTRSRHSWFGRYESVERLELEVIFIERPDGTHEHIETPRRFWISELSTGYAHRLVRRLGLDGSLGARASLTSIPAYIFPRYNANMGFGFTIFALIAPARRDSSHRH